VLDAGPDHHMQMSTAHSQVDGKKVICTGNGWLKEQNQSSTTASKLYKRNAGPSQLQEPMVKSGKI